MKNTIIIFSLAMLSAIAPEPEAPSFQVDSLTCFSKMTFSAEIRLQSSGGRFRGSPRNRYHRCTAHP